MTNEKTNTTTNTTKKASGYVCKCTPTKCWSCKYATGETLPKPVKITDRKTGKKYVFLGCPWATKFVPVPGWKADKTIIKDKVNGETKLETSYHINECPLYESDGYVEPTVENMAKDLGLCMRYVLTNRLYLWDFYDIFLLGKKDALKKLNGKELSERDLFTLKMNTLTYYKETLDLDLKDGEITQAEYEKGLKFLDNTKEVFIKSANKKGIINHEVI